MQDFHGNPDGELKAADRSTAISIEKTPTEELMKKRWDGIRRDYTQADVDRLRGSIQIEHTLARLGAERLWTLISTREFVNALGALTGNQAVQMVKAGLQAIYLSGLASRRRRQPRGTDVPRSEPLSGQLGSQRRAPHQPGSAARRPGSALGTIRRHSLVRTDRRRRRGRVRRPAQRVRADEVHDRGRSGGSPFRGPTRQREEVRPLGREGARPDAVVHPHAQRGALGGRRARRPDRPDRAHRRRRGRPGHQRRRRSRPAFPDRRAHPGGFLPHPGRYRERDRTRPRLRALRGHDLVRDLAPRSRRSAPVRGGHPQVLPRQEAGLQLLTLVQLAQEARSAHDRGLPARARRDGLQVPVS